MRLWSLHPTTLDRVGLVACWREALLAQAVLAGRTKGYRHHPQLERFRAQDAPLEAIGAYLVGLAEEADARGYRFDRTRIESPQGSPVRIPVSDGQLALEMTHLREKLAVRSPEDFRRLASRSATPHPLFVVVSGPVEPWERAPIPPPCDRAASR